jgi:hypothetical protein
VALSLGLLALSFRLWQVAAENGQDFEVYWRAAREWLAGRDPYVVSPDRLGFVFKYPPWILPALAPLGWVAFEPARAAWALVNLLGLAWIVAWIRRAGVGRKASLTATLLFSLVWVAHFSAGQLTLVMTAIALWGLEGGALGEAFAAFGLSAKLLSLVAAAGLARPRERLWRMLGALLALFALANAALLRVSRGAGGKLSLADFYAGFARAAGSGGAELGEAAVRGPGNHGLTALVLRALQVPATAVWADAATCLALALGLGWAWSRAARALDARARWTGWLAMAVIVHPLAWHHSFVMVFPLCALALGRAWQSRAPRLQAAALGAIAGVGFVVPQVFGSDFVRPLELGGIKSWAVLLAAWTLVRASAARARLATAPPLTVEPGIRA